MRLAADGRPADALRRGRAATSALDAHGERYNAARLAAELLAALGDDAPHDALAATAQSLEAMGARASAEALRPFG
jgi:hypothetical protein